MSCSRSAGAYTRPAFEFHGHGHHRPAQEWSIPSIVCDRRSNAPPPFHGRRTSRARAANGNGLDGVAGGLTDKLLAISERQSLIWLRFQLKANAFIRQIGNPAGRTRMFFQLTADVRLASKKKTEPLLKFRFGGTLRAEQAPRSLRGSSFSTCRACAPS
jgi:hypothetical protein